MTYTPINWQTGDTITAEKMNKMDNGWSITSGLQTIFDGSVTTTEGGAFDEIPISVSMDISSVNTLTVILDNTTYNLTGFDDDGYWTFGAPYNDYSTYSFSVYSNNGSVFFTSEAPGTYALILEAPGTVVEVSDNFSAAVKQTGSGELLLVKLGVTTWQEAYDALAAGKHVVYISDFADTVMQREVLEASYSDNSYRVKYIYINSNSAVAVSFLDASSANGALQSN